jgi:hypothetical protein
VWWVENIFQTRADCGTISLRRRYRKDLRAMDKREMELIRECGSCDKEKK